MHGFSEEDLPVAIGHVLGLRWFQLTTQLVRVRVPDPDYPITATAAFDWQVTEKPVLKGARGTWKPGLNTARCLREAHIMAPRHRHGGELHPAPHPVPVRHCGCGFWAYWHLGDQMADAPHIAGLVKGSGKVIKGPEGFRAGQAEVLALVPLAYDQAAALALEAVYGVPVYGTIEALLEMHKAPGTQKPLADDFFWRRRHSLGERSGREQGESHLDYARRIGIAGSAPCMTCGLHVCRDGQARCGNCELGRAPATPGERHETQRALLRGSDALARLHARREGWAKAAPSVLQAPTAAETGAIAAQKADTSQIRQALDYIKARFGDGSWWRQQHPDT